MSENVVYDGWYHRTRWGDFVLGEVGCDNIIGGVILRAHTSVGDPSPHFMRMDVNGEKETGRRKGGTIFGGGGPFQVKHGGQVKKGQPGIFFQAVNGDIVLKCPGKLRIDAADGVEIKTNKDVNINCLQKFIVESDTTYIKSSVSTMIFSEKTVDVVGNHICNIYGGLTEIFDGSTTIVGSKSALLPFIPGTLKELQQALQNVLGK